jgi:gamma-glutamyltranspeptidase/glutathione hydrolase
MRDFHFPGRSAVFADNGAVATSHPLAAQAAIEILKSGGNAMDAAIAGGILLGICEPQMTGIGGDCFVLFSPAGRDDVLAMNGSGVAPAAIDAALLRDGGHTTVPLRHAHAVTVPGAIDAFCQLSNDWGKLGLDRILAPSIHYAETGVPVAPRVAADWVGLIHELHETALPYFSKSGTAPRVGDRYSHPQLAQVLKKIATHGRDGFYTGEVAQDMVDTLRSLGGTHAIDDFAQQTAFYTNPIKGSYRGLDLYEHPPNGQGATAILMGNMLKNFDLDDLDPIGVERTHIEAEVAKLAYDARNRFIADPSEANATERMVSPETAKSLAELVKMDRVIENAHIITEAVHKDTIYITVVDRDRMSVSLIYSIFHGFGSGIASRKYGVLFQNRGAGFTLAQGHPNELRGGARPMHTIIPAMLGKDGVPVMPFGVMGGQYQSNGHIRLVSNMLDYGMSIQDAIDAPRAFAEAGQLKIERGYAPEVVQRLADLGHKVTQDMPAIGGAQAIFIHDNGVLEAGSDPRKDGCALGY